MKYYVFGYGSLINPHSIEVTLGRKIHEDELSLADLRGYTRLWRLVVKVIVHDYAQEKPVNAVFLDIKKNAKSFVNGVLINVSANELKKLDVREKSYERIDITDIIKPSLQSDDKVYSYVGKPSYFVENYYNPIVLKQYQKIISQGLLHWGSKFAKIFNLTTQSPNFKVVDGSYKFLDSKQNILTGHS